MVAVTILIAVIGILALLGFAVHRINPKRFKLSAGVWKVLTLNVEVDSGSGTDVEKPPNVATLTALPEADQQKALPKGGG
jgi:hypothetical protein